MAVASVSSLWRADKWGDEFTCEGLHSIKKEQYDDGTPSRLRLRSVKARSALCVSFQG